MGTDQPRRARWRAVVDWAGSPRDIAGLVAFRVLFGLICAGSAFRFVLKGWVETVYLQPTFHFRYEGFAWIPEPNAFGLYALFVVMFLGGLGIAAGAFYRLSAAAWWVAFVWVELLEEATYLNHYYLMTLLGVVVLALPLHAAGSVDARRGAVTARASLPAWMSALLRGQIAVVYLFAGIAKLNADWLLAGEPLHTWLRAMGGVPGIGPWLTMPAVALVMAWSGAAYDLTIPLWLSLPRTRAAALLAVVGFHVTTWLLFPIGVFPWVMIAASTVFLPPSWPRRWWRGLPALATGDGRSASALGGGTRWPLVLAAVWMAVQIAVPLRAFVLPGDAAWTGRGFRFSWRVMLIEKTGLVEYRLVDRTTGEQRRVSPRAALTPQQYKMLCSEQELVAEYAQHLAQQERQRGRDVAVYADAFLSLNGRAAARSVDPAVDLSVPSRRLPEHWIPPRPGR